MGVMAWKCVGGNSLILCMSLSLVQEGSKIDSEWAVKCLGTNENLYFQKTVQMGNLIVGLFSIAYHYLESNKRSF